LKKVEGRSYIHLRMKIFVTGACGFLGRGITSKLLGEGHSVTALLLPNEEAGPLAGAGIVRGDVTRPETLAGKLDSHDAVVHLAGAVGYGQSWELCRNVNHMGTRNVAREAVAAGVRRFMHMSSVSVYGRVPNVEITEDFPHRKIGDPYGDTKIEAEKELKRLEGEGKLDLTMIRPTVVYGPGDDKFLPRLVERMKRGTMRVIGDGENTVDLIHVRDVADFVALVLREAKSIGHAYNLTNPENPTWNQMLVHIAKFLGVPPPRKHVPYRTAMFAAALAEYIAPLIGKPPVLSRYTVRVIGRQYHYSTAHMREHLGFVPSIDLLEGVTECLKEPA